MFKKLFGRPAGPPPAAPVSAADAARARAAARAAGASSPAIATAPAGADAPHPAEAALLNAIAERLPEDPLIGAKIGGQEVFNKLLRGFKSERGVHAETLLSALGGLAGYACQASVRAAAVARGLQETTLLMTIDTADGRRYFYGDALNKPLAESTHSVWAFAAGAAQEAGCTTLPDLNEMFAHVSQTLGGPDFGKPRMPPGHALGEMPLDVVRALWPALLPLVGKFCPDAALWPVLYAIAARHAIMAARQTLDPGLALTIVMESAIPMSKIDLAAG